ncbi:MAG TPA: 50S ribosomal protein L18 [Chloroflexi bacterium]|nr:50S ribosomal protein L18 [Candidatus Bipolaricaulota bacterium]RLD07201.1 MAG: 50S ribosomal protein L18 [Chloroflexota bacterium]HDD25344.1 50S ribosomal protein L18 [Chloroflexota bacterium]HHE51450.1 50S ribosomal protein L18 [Candidatus Acetothermia bacterium]
MAMFNRKAERVKRHLRLRKKVHGTQVRPRLCVTRTLRHIYAQVIDDDAGRTLVAASTLDKELRGKVSGSNKAAAEQVGELLAARALEKNIEAVVFDRGGHPYHGVIATLAEACRKGGLRF